MSLFNNGRNPVRIWESFVNEHFNHPLLKAILTPYSIIAIVFWTLCWIANISQIFNIGFFPFSGVCIFGYIYTIAIADIIYFIRKKTPRPTRQPQPQTQTVSPAPQPTYTFLRPYDQMDGHEFEHYCGQLLQKNSFSNVEVTRGSGDQGIDIIAYKDGIKYGIQCKCYSSDIGNKAVQEAFAGKTFYNCHIAAVLTNRHFTRSAQELASRNGVLLWDREKLEDLIRHQ